MVGRCISYGNSLFLGDMLVLGAVTAEFRQNNETPKTPLPSFFLTDVQGILGRFCFSV